MTPLLELRGVGRVFERRRDFADRLLGRVPSATVRAVDAVDLTIAEGEVVGLVGESGCGKSTLGRIAAGILPPTTGEVRFRGQALTALAGEEARRAALAVQMIFQDPYASLNPRMPVGDIVAEGPLVHRLVPRESLSAHIDDLFRRVGLDPEAKRRYPHQFSGGQRQRIGIARALAVSPSLVVCDEAVAALDVSVQAQVLNLFMRLRAEFGLAYLFISHDLGIVEHLSDRVAVMYLGRIVETAPAERLFASAAHPYTRGLLAEVPRIDRRRRRFAAIEGELPSPLAPPPGCYFHPRCPLAIDRCRAEAPTLSPIAEGHTAACHRPMS